MGLASYIWNLQVLFRTCKFHSGLASSISIPFKTCKLNSGLAISIWNLQVLFRTCKFHLELASSIQDLQVPFWTCKFHLGHASSIWDLQSVSCFFANLGEARKCCLHLSKSWLTYWLTEQGDVLSSFAELKINSEKYKHWFSFSQPHSE